jgi:hypothetical protein
MKEVGLPDSAQGPRIWVVAAIYLALTLLLTYPLSLNPATAITWSDADTDLFMWTLAWDAHAIVDRPLHVFDANIYHPYGLTLAYSENLLGSAFVAAPILWITGNPVLALNSVVLLSVFLCALGGYVLAQRLGLSAPSAFLCGLVFAFAPARFFRITQVFLATVQWIPFTLAYLHTYLDAGRRSALVIAACFFSLQALTSGHAAVFLVLAVGCVIAARLALGGMVAVRSRIRDLGIVAALLLPAVLITIPYHIVQDQMGLRRTLGQWAPTPQSFLAAPTHVQSWLLSFFPDAHVLERATGLLFPGFLTVLLAAVGFLPLGAAHASDRPRATSALKARLPYALLTFLAVFLVGPLWPYVYWLPGLNFIRANSRFMIPAMLGLAVLAAVGFERIRDVVPVHRRRLLTIAMSVLLLTEFVAAPLQVVPYEVKIPSADRWLNGQPKPFVVAEVPVELYDRYQTAYMFHSMAHWQRTVHGYSGIRPALHEQLYRDLRRFPDDRSLDALASLGVTYVVVHSDQYHQPGEWEAVAERLTAYTSRLTLEYQDKSARVYSITRRTAAR